MKPTTEEKIEGGVLGIIGIILFAEFAADDAYIFGTTAPPIIQKASNLLGASPLVIDILTTIALIVLVMLMATERKIGERKGKKLR